MYSPVTRLLTVLDLLQSRPSITALQLAERLQVNTRSARRYITMLQDLGIPVEAERGRYGGYKLRPGYKLPPLMLTEDEAMAVTLGLRAAQQIGLAKTLPTVESTLAKVERVLPLALRERVQAVQEIVVLDLPAASEAAMTNHISILSIAAYRGQRVRRNRASRAKESWIATACSTIAITGMPLATAICGRRSAFFVWIISWPLSRSRHISRDQLASML
jgi:predicted DNA-binding transcriptional regulator YafY